MKQQRTKTIALLAMAVSAAAHAQVPPPDAGSILRDQTQPRLELPTRPAPEIKIEQPVRPAMKPNEVRFVLKNIRFSGNTVYTQGDLVALVRDSLGKEIGFVDLESITARISRYYRDNGYMVARAYLPAQDIRDGDIEIAVIEGRASKININNKSPVSESTVRNYVDSLNGKPIYLPHIERKLLLLDDLAGVAETRATLRPGANFGESEITYDIFPTPRLTGLVEFENHGNRFTGQNRVSAHMNVNSPLGLGDLFSLRATHSFEGLEYGRVSYDLPVGGDGMKIGAAYSVTRYKLSIGTFDTAEFTGNGDTYTLSMSYPLVRGRNFNVYGKVAYDWREFEDRLASNTTINGKRTRALAATLSGDLRDGVWGGGVSVFALTYNSGSVTITTPATLIADAGSARTNGAFDKWNLNLLRLQAITQNTSLYLSFAGQQAGKNLDSSEKFILGGANGVRAYPQGEGTGDTGYVGTAELRYNTSFGWLPGSLMPFAFVDAGTVHINQTPFALTANTRHLMGGGVGLSWSRPQDFMIKLTIATRIGNRAQASVSSDTDRHTRGWLHLMKYF